MANRRFLNFLWSLALFSLGGCASPPPVSSLAPDLILHSGKVVMVNSNFDIAEALAIRDGKITAVGSNAEIRLMAGERTVSSDLRGKTVIPGLIDSHSHPTNHGRSTFRPDVSQVTSLAEMMELIKAKVQESDPGDWVISSRLWSVSKLEEKRNPTRFDLDPVSPENPVYLDHGGHMGVLNTAAMQLLGLTKDNPDPPGGAIERDPESGELTGRMFESAAEQVREKLPELTVEQLIGAQLQSFRELAAAGVTSVREAGVFEGSHTALRALMQLHKRGELPLSVSFMIFHNPNEPVEELEKFLKWAPVASGLGDEMLKIWGVKMMADGGSYSAYLRKEHPNKPGYYGQPGGTPESYAETVKKLNQYGWRVGIHALGDAAIDMVLDAYEAADEERSISGKRWAIEHGYFLKPEHFERIKRLGLVIHPQTRHLSELYEAFRTNYGQEYADTTHQYRTLIEQGIPIAAGRDWPTRPNDHFLDMWTEITRQTGEGKVIGPEHKLSREEALRFRTIWAAYSTFEENLKGSIEPGKFADLVVLSDDYLTVPEDEIRNITPLVTISRGKIIFQKDNDFFQ